MKTITSRHNPIVGRFRDAARDPSALILLDGLHLVEEAIEARVSIAALAISPAGQALAGAGRLIDWAEHAKVDVYSVSDTVVRAMSPVTTPSGMVALGERPSCSLGDAFAHGPAALVIVALDVQDPGNAGAIVRSADAGGATAVIFSGRSADPFSWKALRGSMGAVFHLPVVTAPLPDVLAASSAAGITVAATVPRGGVPLHDVNMRDPLTLLLGSEGSGLPDAIVRLADRTISIPMRDRAESLNVAVAAAILVYEAARQRKLS